MLPKILLSKTSVADKNPAKRSPNPNPSPNDEVGVFGDRARYNVNNELLQFLPTRSVSITVLCNVCVLYSRGVVYVKLSI
jgi:hypothetical protein